MINVHVSGDNFDDIIRQIEMMEFPDLSPLIEPLREIMIDDNRDGLLAGTDGDGVGMRPLRNSTLKTRDGDGPPLAPQYGDARIITGYRVEPAKVEPLLLRLIGYWPDLEWVRFHVSGFHVRNRLGEREFIGPRNPTGIRPESLPKIAAVLENFARKLVGG